MEPIDVLPTIVRGSGRSMQSMSLQLGRSRNYITQTIQNLSVSKVDTVAEIADVCGYDLLLRKRDDGSEIVIDPPRRGTTD